MTKTTREKTTYKQISGYNDWTTKPEMKTPNQHEQREQAKADLKKKIVKKLLIEGVQVTMSVAKALDEFINVDVTDKIEHLLEKERQEFIDILENIKRYANGETATSRGQIVEFIDIEAQKLSTFKPKEKTK